MFATFLLSFRCLTSFLETTQPSFCLLLYLLDALMEGNEYGKLFLSKDTQSMIKFIKRLMGAFCNSLSN